MSDIWDDRITAHPVRAQLRLLSERVDRTETGEGDAGLAHLRRVSDALAEASTRVEAADPRLASTAALDRLKSQLPNLESPLDSFDAESNPAYLEQAAVAADAILDAAASLPSPPPDRKVAAADKRVREVSDRAKAALNELRDLGRRVERELEAVNASLGAISSAGETRLAELSQRIDEAAVTVNEQGERLESALGDFTGQSEAALTDARQAFEAAQAQQLDDARDLVESTLDELRSRSDEMFAASKEAAVSATAELEGFRDQAAELVGVVAELSTAGHYQKLAEAEKKAADFWRWVTVAAALAVVAIGVWIAISSHGDGDFGWGRFAGRVFLTVPLAGVAAYAGNQSGSHRAVERRSRQIQLVLAAIDPYVQSLPAEEQQRFKAQLGERIFVGGVTDDEISDAVGAPALLGVIKELLVAKR